LNVLKKAPAFGVWQTVPGLYHSRTLAAASSRLSWICLDCEHGIIPLQGGATECIAAINSVRAGGEGPPSVLVRIPATGASTGTGWQIKLALDAGAHGVIVPMVSTAAKAREIVKESRFPPVGIRGFGNPFTPSLWNQSPGQYLTGANNDILVIVQIETKEAVENLEEIASVDGIDCLFIGPYDLSLSLGYPPPSPDPHPEVEVVISKILNAAKKYGKYCAFYCTTGAQAKKRAEQGFDLINVASDVGAFTDGVTGHLNAASGVDEPSVKKSGY